MDIGEIFSTPPLPQASRLWFYVRNCSHRERTDGIATSGVTYLMLTYQRATSGTLAAAGAIATCGL